MEPGTREVLGPGGRRLTVWVGGEGDDFALFHAGTPEDGSLHRSWVETGARHGFKCVGYSRPGYRCSDRLPGRRIVDCADDVAAILDALAIESVVMVGGSGGGPHALACAERLPNRVRAVATMGSNAPRRADGLDWYLGMGEENLAEFGAAEVGPEALEKHLTTEAAKWLAAKPEDVLVHFEDMLPDTAREDMTPDALEIAARSMQDALVAGIWGWFDDDMATVMDWGFDPASIEIPVAIWHAGEDRFIPPAHGKWLAKMIPHASSYFRPEEDHISLGKQFDTVFDSLLAVAG